MHNFKVWFFCCVDDNNLHIFESTHLHHYKFSFYKLLIICSSFSKICWKFLVSFQKHCTLLYLKWKGFFFFSPQQHLSITWNQKLLAQKLNFLVWKELFLHGQNIFQENQSSQILHPQALQCITWRTLSFVHYLYSVFFQQLSFSE